MKRLLKNKKSFYRWVLALLAPVVMAFSFITPVYAGNVCGGGPNETPVNTAINLGCTGQGNPIMDMLFAFVRILSAGVGIVVIASVIVGGIQYSASRGDPQAAAAATKRLTSSVMALFIYIFAYSLLNFVIPGGFFN